MARITPGASYVPVVLPAVVVFGVGLMITVTPLTAAVLAAVPESQAGTASGVNNAVARLAGLLAVAMLPVAAGINPGVGEPLGHGFTTAMLIAAAASGCGGIIAALTIRTGTDVAHHFLAGTNQACQHPCTKNVDRNARRRD